VDILVFAPSNHPPVAVGTKLSPVGTPLIGEVVTLDASASFDPEAHALGFSWSQTAGPRVFLTGPNTAHPTFAAILPGTYEFQLAVTDGVHLSPSTTLRVAIKPDAPYVLPTLTAAFTTAATIDALTGHVTTTGVAINLVSTQTPGTTSWWWEQIAGPATVLAPEPFNADPSFTPSVPGLYRFRLTGTDPSGPGSPNRGFSESVTLDVVVDAVANAAPVADAGPNQPAILTGQLVTLNGLNSGDDNMTFGAGLTAYWRQVVGPPVQLSNPYAAQPTFVAKSAGVYVFELVVDDGLSSTKPSVTQVVVSLAPTTGGGGSGGGGGSCGLSGLEPMLVILVAAVARRRRR
jgi:hypothetical protein